MKQRVRLLSLVVAATVVLLAVAGTLIVVGIFNWYCVIRDEQDEPVAVLRIDGNPRENFREYVFGS